MGLAWSKRHHHHRHRHRQQNHQETQQFEQQHSPQSSTAPFQPPPHPPPPTPPQQPPSTASPYPSPPPQHPCPSLIRPPLPPPPPPLPPPPPIPPPPYYNYSNFNIYPTPIITHSSYHPHPYFIPPTNLWPGFRPLPQPALPPPPLPAVPYVDHQSAKKIKNDVNVRKESIRLEIDESNNDSQLVCFTFDAMVDGSITILYFGKEGANCTFTSVYPDILPAKIPFQKGIGQKFCQPSGSGIDLGFFEIDNLSKPLQGDVFPLVILAESTLPSMPLDGQTHGQSVDTSSHAQITLAVLEKNNESRFLVKVIKQILWIDEVRYELREIFGISNSVETTINDQNTGTECVICMTEPKDTTVLPCRHMCMCSECAKELRLQSNKCPICRQPIEELLEIKVDEAV